MHVLLAAIFHRIFTGRLDFKQNVQLSHVPFSALAYSNQHHHPTTTTTTSALFLISPWQTQHMPVNIAARFLLIRARRWLITQTNWNQHTEWALIKKREISNLIKFRSLSRSLRLPDRLGAVLAHYSLGRLFWIIRWMKVWTKYIRQNRGEQVMVLFVALLLEVVGFFFSW